MDDLDRLTQTLPEDEQRAVAKRADDLGTAHNLLELQARAGRTQEDALAGASFKQTHVSRPEKRADMKLPTLRGYYVESLGDTLKIVADAAGKKADLSSIAEGSRRGSKI